MRPYSKSDTNNTQQTSHTMKKSSYNNPFQKEKFTSATPNPKCRWKMEKGGQDNKPVFHNSEKHGYSKDSALQQNNRWNNDKRAGYSNNRFNNGGHRRNNFRKNSRWNNKRSSYFRQTESPVKPSFKYSEEDFPTLGAPQNKKVTNTFMNFREAAEKGEKCPTPPPRPPLPPPERLERPRRQNDDYESDGWNTEDEREAKAADPSDDEEEEDPDFFWKLGGK